MDKNRNLGEERKRTQARMKELNDAYILPENKPIRDKDLDVLMKLYEYITSKPYSEENRGSVITQFDKRMHVLRFVEDQQKYLIPSILIEFFLKQDNEHKLLPYIKSYAQLESIRLNGNNLYDRLNNLNQQIRAVRPSISEIIKGDDSRSELRKYLDILIAAVYNSNQLPDYDENTIEGFLVNLENILKATVPPELAKLMNKADNADNALQGGKPKTKPASTRQKIHIGPKGGKYYIRNGRKVYC